ncbi:hypothetical protein HY626_04115 [Candidatus Uhrbacteria bacterium]|nr:hypothetical protein [Candidatus Uhrbacteria bacterium]
MTFSAFKTRVKRYPLFSTTMLGGLTDRVPSLKVQLSQWKKKGWVRALRRGLYVLSPEERTHEPSLFYLANQIYIPSYVSLESALALYGLIPEFVAATTSVSVRKTARFRNDFGLFTYQQVCRGGFRGFRSIPGANDISILVASPEKALVDFFYLNLASFNPGDRAQWSESYRFQNCSQLQPAELKAHARRFNSKKLMRVVTAFVKACVR